MGLKLGVEIFHSARVKIEQLKEELLRTPERPVARYQFKHEQTRQFKHTNVISTDIDHIPSNMKQ